MEVNTKKSIETLPIHIPKSKNTQPPLGLDWLDKLEIGLQVKKNPNIIADDRRDRIISEYEVPFNNNHTINDLTIDIQLKED